MKRRSLRRTMLQFSVAGSLGLALTLALISGGTGVSIAQVSLSPTCSILDPLTGLCQTVTSIISPVPTTTTTTPLPTSTSTSSAPLGGSTSTSSGTTSGATSGATKAARSTRISGGKGSFGGSAYPPGGLFYGAYAGNYGGGATYFAPNGQTVSSSQVYYQSAFGAPVSQAVATAAVGPSIGTAPVASAVTQLPRPLVLLFPPGLLVLLFVTSLVLEVNEGGVGPHTALVRARI
jgi:hypothetical protein